MSFEISRPRFDEPSSSDMYYPFTVLAGHPHYIVVMHKFTKRLAGERMAFYESNNRPLAAANAGNSNSSKVALRLNVAKLSHHRSVTFGAQHFNSSQTHSENRLFPDICLNSAFNPVMVLKRYNRIMAKLLKSL